MGEGSASLESVFRHEYGRIIATLIRRCGSFEVAEEAMQEAFAAALVDWQIHGVPRAPAAWITTTAQRKLIDAVRRERTRRIQQDAVSYELELSATDSLAEERDMSDQHQDPLRLIFTCCHPALNREAQIALTLRTLGGLTTEEIARAFLLPEPTLAQRLVRARHKIRAARIPYQIPPDAALRERLAAVQTVLYLIFNEGYLASQGDALIRHELCAEAIRLAQLLCELQPGAAESFGLWALMLLHDARRKARVDAYGNLITLEEQDRSLWEHERIVQGLALVEQALQTGPLGPYQLQAAIAALHVQASTAQATDWPQIAALYGELERLQPAWVVALNRAVAIGMAEGPQRGLELIERIGHGGRLDDYHLFHAARADLLRRQGEYRLALEAYRTAAKLTVNASERAFLQRRLQALEQRMH